MVVREWLREAVWRAIHLQVVMDLVVLERLRQAVWRVMPLLAARKFLALVVLAPALAAHRLQLSKW